MPARPELCFGGSDVLGNLHDALYCEPELTSMAAECMMPSDPLELVGETMRHYRCITASVCQGQISDLLHLEFYEVPESRN